jgi:hypothetical protein
VGSLSCKKKKSNILFLHGKNGGEILIGYTFRVGYTYRADCNSFFLLPLLYLTLACAGKEGGGEWFKSGKLGKLFTKITTPYQKLS